MLVWHGTSLPRFRLMQEVGFCSDRHALYVGDTLACADHYASLRSREDADEAVVLELDYQVLCDLAEPRVIRRPEGPPVFDPSHRAKGCLHPDFHWGNEMQRGQWVFTGEWESALRGAWIRKPHVAFGECLWEPPGCILAPQGR